MHVDIGGAALAGGEHGHLELARIVLDVAESVEAGVLAVESDERVLRDYNGATVGFARMVPDWTVGEQVWVTTDEGSLLKSTVHAVTPSVASPGYSAVTCRFMASHELLTAVLVNAWGHDHHGRPVLGRAR